MLETLDREAHPDLLLESWATFIANETQTNFAISFLCGVNQAIRVSEICVKVKNHLMKHQQLVLVITTDTSLRKLNSASKNPLLTPPNICAFSLVKVKAVWSRCGNHFKSSSATTTELEHLTLMRQNEQHAVCRMPGCSGILMLQAAFSFPWDYPGLEETDDGRKTSRLVPDLSISKADKVPP